MRKTCYAGPWVLIGWLLLVAGCGAPSLGSTERFVPNADGARQALAAALDAWCKGEPPGKLEGSPLVCVVDNHRRPGQKLTRYKILGEVPGDTPRCFAVRLHLDNPREEVRARYILLGIDPLWVYRHEDYEMFIHWACGQEEDDKTSTQRAPLTSGKRSDAAKDRR